MALQGKVTGITELVSTGYGRVEGAKVDAKRALGRKSWGKLVIGKESALRFDGHQDVLPPVD
jgi:hypothetical protein